MILKIENIRNFKDKHEILRISGKNIWAELTITEAKEVVKELQMKIMYAESNELISTFLRNHGMDEPQVETAITQLNKLREKL